MKLKKKFLLLIINRLNTFLNLYANQKWWIEIKHNPRIMHEMRLMNEKSSRSYGVVTSFLIAPFVLHTRRFSSTFFVLPSNKLPTAECRHFCIVTITSNNGNKARNCKWELRNKSQKDEKKKMISFMILN